MSIWPLLQLSNTADKLYIPLRAEDHHITILDEKVFFISELRSITPSHPQIVNVPEPLGMLVLKLGWSGALIAVCYLVAVQNDSAIDQQKAGLQSARSVYCYLMDADTDRFT